MKKPTLYKEREDLLENEGGENATRRNEKGKKD